MQRCRRWVATARRTPKSGGLKRPAAAIFSIDSRKVQRTLVHRAVHARCAELQDHNFARMTPTPPTEARLLPLLGEAALRDFIGAGSVTRLEAVGRPGGFDLRVHMGATEATLGNTRGGTRLFGSIDSVAKLLQRLGVTAFEVDLATFSPAPLKTLRASMAVSAALHGLDQSSLPVRNPDEKSR